MLLLIAFLAVLAIILIFFVTQFYYAFFKGYAPFISTKNRVISRIIEELKKIGVKDGVKVCELGSGMAGFLRAMEKNFPQSELTGIEYSILPYCLSRLQIGMQKSKIKIFRKNFLDENLSDADIIYCYLSVELMRLLEDKFLDELKPGTIIVSYQFHLPVRNPNKIIDLSEIGRKEKLYIYQI
jgi:hypothetical protein